MTWGSSRQATVAPPTTTPATRIVRRNVLFASCGRSTTSRTVAMSVLESRSVTMVAITQGT
jgi:hypothetical protein